MASDNNIGMAAKYPELDEIVNEWRWEHPQPMSKVSRGFARSVVEKAVEALWTFLNRPLACGSRWGLVESPMDPTSFAKHVVSWPGGLAELCRDYLGHERLTAEEEDALLALVVLSDSINLSSVEHGNLNRLGDCDRGLRHRDTTLCGEKVDVDSTDRRIAERNNVVIATDLCCGDLQYRIRLRNISSNGAMIEGAPKLPTGSSAAVRIEDIGWIEGTIAWSLGSRCGLGFDQTIDPAAARIANLSQRPSSS